MHPQGKFLPDMGASGCCSSVIPVISLKIGPLGWVVPFLKSEFWNSANRELFMEPGCHPPEQFECTQVWNCGTLAQFEAAMANGLVATEDLACCLHSRAPSPQISGWVRCTAKPARVSLMGSLTESWDVTTQIAVGENKLYGKIGYCYIQLWYILGPCITREWSS